MTVPASDSYQTLGYYLDLCQWLGFWDCCEVLERRIAASPAGAATRCQTRHSDMVDALFKAHIKGMAERGELKPPAEEPPPAEEDTEDTGGEEEANDDL